MTEKILMSRVDMDRALVRVAHEITERNDGAEALVLVGMQTRGVPLAQRLAATIQTFENTTVPVGSLDITLYRDDLSSMTLGPVVHRTDVPADVTDKHVILVDDVFFTGRSIRAAMDAIMDLGRPQTVRRVKIDEPQPYQRIQAFQLQYHDGNAWKTFHQGTTIGPDFSVEIEPITAQRIRLNILKASDGPTLTEFMLF